jgi:DNA-binding transcriptional MerR regulator
MDKSPEAFRTISEVAEALETPAHVLRFWESRFPQIRPVKRAGGRRYYRPSDVALLAGIKRLLHDEGMTIRGVQKILREQGIRHVAGLVEEEASPEELELGAVMAGLAEDRSEATESPEDTAEATAAALEAALAPPGPVVVPLYPAPEAGDAAEDEDDLIKRMIARDSAEAPAAAEKAAEAADAPASPPPHESPRDEAEATATLAARLRALPRGSLAGQAAELSALSARIAALRTRLAAPPQPAPERD